MVMKGRSPEQLAFILAANFTVARELKKTGVRVLYGDAIQPPFNLVFKYVDEFVLLPNHWETEEYVETLCRKIGHIGGVTLLPCSTVTVGIVSCFSKRLKSVADFLVPNQEAMRTVFDKLQCVKVAKLTGVPVPETREFTDPKDADHFPQVVKPRFETGNAQGFTIIRDESDAEKAFTEKRFGPLLLQEYIPCSSRQMRCCNLLFDRFSKLKAFFTVRKFLEVPITGGTTIGGASSIDPEIVDLARKLLSSLSWKGVAEVEFKIDPKDGQPKLMEVNPRFWAYLELPIRCGVNFPLLLHKLCLGEEFDSILSYPEGVGYINLTRSINLTRKPIMLLKGLVSVPRIRGLVYGWHPYDFMDLPGSLGLFLKKRCLKNKSFNKKSSFHYYKLPAILSRYKS